jgi:hypothetical protein
MKVFPPKLCPVLTYRTQRPKNQIARKWLMTTSEEGRLPSSIRPVVERANPQRTNFESVVSYDTTKALLCFMIAMCVIV